VDKCGIQSRLEPGNEKNTLFYYNLNVGRALPFYSGRRSKCAGLKTHQLMPTFFLVPADILKNGVQIVAMQLFVHMPETADFFNYRVFHLFLV
jgi:hypothetical protein